MFLSAVYFAVSLWLALSIAIVWRLRDDVVGTTLIDAWRWCFGACCVWAVGWCCEFIPSVRAGIRDQIWYAAALLFLAALISILGAKRPGSRVWTCFVTIPMLLCLSWPALFSWLQGWPPIPIRLMTPALVAYSVVCIMGLGNYVGTRFLSSAFWLGLALGCLVIPYCGWTPETIQAVNQYRLMATLCAGMSVIWPCCLAATSREVLAPWDRVWVDFINLFGIAWGRRIQDRFNETARQAKWGVKLDFYGLIWDDPAPQSMVVDTMAINQIDNEKTRETKVMLSDREKNPNWTPEMIAAIQWLLRRFVDQIWIDRRIARNT